MSSSLDLHSIRDFERLDFLARQVVEGFITGLHQSPYHGFSVEFAEHRLYNTGESTRHIDWKLYARTDKMFVKRYEEETNLRCQIVLDTSGSMLFPDPKAIGFEEPNKLAFSVYGAASLMNLLRRQRDAVGLTTINEKVDLHTEAKTNRAHHHMLLTELSKVITDTSENKSTHLAPQLHELAERLHRRSLVIIFSDFLERAEQEGEELFEALQHFRYNKHELVLLHVEDGKLEREFEFGNKPHRFVDLESGEELKLHPEEVREEYKKVRNSLIKEIELRCGQFKIDWVEANIRLGYNQVLLPYLLKRRKLY
ncbi:DUF58 domain-containing protein [Phaeocystidibacter luteus]|uniref:DUF58 domain-containing protein n=1 Tax=Phaeocystidibacter luteus TaxID=911197 RepID=A0A6N6RGQ9_9FLAO|nr:DUF58 domain-containing protein [Phaeocystidibacter luteus]KAB2809933.1 DUF58 domain-containing protein [Phaeocystidibacter luteus]